MSSMSFSLILNFLNFLNILNILVLKTISFENWNYGGKFMRLHEYQRTVMIKITKRGGINSENEEHDKLS